MRVQHGKRGFFERHVLEQRQQNHVFEHVGMVARVKSVSVTEHGSYGNRRLPQ